MTSLLWMSVPSLVGLKALEIPVHPVIMAKKDAAAPLPAALPVAGVELSGSD
jgi:hypothetical protein